jgi:hypothetical protein
MLLLMAATYTHSGIVKEHILFIIIPRDLPGSLIDGGANGGLCRSNKVDIKETLLTADPTGIANNTF